jgi:hypothetical protein
MGYLVKFDNGMSVNFDTQPTAADIEEAHTHLVATSTAKPQATIAQPNVASQIPDSFPPQPEPAKPGVLDRLNAGVEAATNVVAGLPDMIPGALAVGTNFANTLAREHRIATPSELEKAFTAGAGVTGLGETAYRKSSDLGQEYTDKLNDILMGPLGIQGLHALHTTPGIIDPKAALSKFSSESIPKPVEKAPPSERLAALAKLDERAPTAAPEQTPAPEAPLTDTRTSLQKTQEAYAAALREQELARQSAFNRPDSLPDLTQQETPMQRMARQLGAPEMSDGSFGQRSGIRDMANRLTEDISPSDKLTPDEAKMKATQDAQAALEARQAELEYAVKRQTALDTNASERARQEAASAVSDVHKALVEEQERQAASEQSTKAAADADAQHQAALDQAAQDEAEAQQRYQDAQTELEKRQALQDFEVARQTSLDLNANERRRQESAGVPLETDVTRPGYWTGPNAPLGSAARAALMRKQGGRLLVGKPFSLEEAKAKINDLGNYAKDKSDAMSDYIKSLQNYRYNSEQAGKDYLGSILGKVQEAATRFKSPDTPEQAVAKVMDSGATDIKPMSGFSKSVQVGLSKLALREANNPLFMHVHRVFDYAVNKTNMITRAVVNPVEKIYSSLPMKDFMDVQGALKKGMFREQAYTPEQLRSAGFSDRMVTAYEMQRKAYDAVFDLTNASRKLLGKDPITKLDHYFASSWHGDWHMPITKDKIGKDGKVVIDPTTGKPKQELVWYIRTSTEKEANKALQYLKDNHSDTLNLKEAKPEFRGGSLNPEAPRDFAGAYQDMMEYASDHPEVSKAIQEVLEGYQADRGYSYKGHNVHFLEKSNIRGFEGDRPWLSAKENAYQGAHSQINYLRGAIRWANHQEAIANAKEVLSNPDVLKKMPNAVDVANNVVAHESGTNAALFRNLENAIAEKMGVSRGSLFRGSGDLKSMTYLTQLGFNAAYSLAATAQYSITGPAFHLMLAKEGFKPGVIGGLKTIGLGVSDAAASFLTHMAHEAGATSLSLPMSDLGKRALAYAEDSGMVTKNLTAETGGVGEHAGFTAMKNLTSSTIGMPEKAVRLHAFMGFVHHLEATGKFAGDELGMFRKAQEFTDHAVGNFNSHARPTFVADAGIIGQQAYVYKSFVFHYMHDMYMAGREAKNKNVGPLLALLGGYALVAGVQNMPVLNELDGAWNLTKQIMAEAAPEFFAKHEKMRNFDLKANAVSMFPETAGIRSLMSKGLLTSATGADVGSHMATQVLDFEHPLNNLPLATTAQEAKEWASLAKMGYHQNADSVLSAVHANVPPLFKGLMESHIDAFKSGNNPQSQLMFKPDELNSAKTMEHRRTPTEAGYRDLGLTAYTEAQDKRNIYRTNQEEQNVSAASKKLEEHVAHGIKTIDSDAGVKQLVEAAVAYKTLNPNANISNLIMTQGIDVNTTPLEQKELHMKQIRALQYYQRYAERSK